MNATTFRISAAMMRELEAHLFPGDGDEHGAVIAASVLTTENGTRFLAHRLFLARDGVDYVSGHRGYRMLTATFVMDCVLACADLQMAYFAVHCHGGTTTVGFSKDDSDSHERGYPALLDILVDQPVGALVFAQAAVAGDIWFPTGSRVELDEFVVASRPIRRLRSRPESRSPGADDCYERQTRLFGDRGQGMLKKLKVGVIGAGGAGSLIVEYLARVGVGHLVVVDPERIEPSNLSRIVGSRRQDTLPLLTHPVIPSIVREPFKHLRSTKVAIARRVAIQANPNVRFQGEPKDIVTDVAETLIDADYVFLAADSMQARLVFNALVHQYLIPGVQVGAKAQVDPDTGNILDLFVAVRPLIPGVGCLWCNGLILAAQLQDEATDPQQRRRQRYVDDDVPAPSVITLNAVASSLACDDFLMSLTGLLDNGELRWVKMDPRTRQWSREIPRKTRDCRECSVSGRLGRGPTRRLPLKQPRGR